MSDSTYRADVVVAGGGLAGLVTAYELLDHGKKALLVALESHPRRANLEILFDREINDIEITNDRATALLGRSMQDNAPLRAAAESLVIASGGICGGDLSKVRANWNRALGEPPGVLLNGAHKYGDGLLHDRVAALGGNLTHLEKQWHYAAGIF